jgi:lactoylglutathione lyase
MTEFQLNENVKLGLMPAEGIKKIIREKLPDVGLGNGIPRCELYLKIRGMEGYFQRARDMKAIEVDQLSDLDWGDRVVYFADPDGHIIAFAETIE